MQKLHSRSDEAIAERLQQLQEDPGKFGIGPDFDDVIEYLQDFDNSQQITQWTEADFERLLELIPHYGLDYRRISERLGNKTPI